MLAMPFFMIDGSAHPLAPSWRSTPGLPERCCSSTAGALPAFVLMQIVNRAFYARQDTKTPMRVAMFQVAANVALGLILFRYSGWGRQGHRGGHQQTASWLSVVQMIVILKRRGHYALSPSAVSRLLRVLAASLLLGLILSVIQSWLRRHALPIALGPIHYKEPGPRRPGEPGLAALRRAAVRLGRGDAGRAEGGAAQDGLEQTLADSPKSDGSPSRR